MRDEWVRTLAGSAKKIGFFTGLGLVVLAGTMVCAQTADQAWLRFTGNHGKASIPFLVRSLGDGNATALKEVEQGLNGLYGELPTASQAAAQGEIAIGTIEQVKRAYPSVKVPAKLGAEAFWITRAQLEGRQDIIIAGASDRGVLYGAFAFLRYVAQFNAAPPSAITSTPGMPIRWTDEWDNIDGSVERGYGGRSIFFEAGHVREDLAPVREYARLLASVGINGCNINNVNNAAPFLQPEMLAQVKRIADTMRPYGVRVALSADVASPKTIGGLATYDPLDPAVIAWWKSKVDDIYTYIPDFAGFTVKADSEGQPGPASYGRTPADAANTLANALEPHGGVVLYRAFVYNHHLDWKDPKADRARAAYDIFHPLDGKFAPNVIVQVKEGPIDFQAQEPVSPLFAGLEKTNQAMELQITQEYLGQQRHLVYIAPMWKWVLDFDLRGDNRPTPVKEIIAGKKFNRPLGGMIGVSCVGQNWLGSPLAMANLYAFGRLAWNPNLTAQQIAQEWTRQTLGSDPQVVSTVTKMLMQSWPAYVDYTGPLGMQTLTGITGSHYGPNIEASENNGWGQWHRADREGVGMDRSVATGTGYAGQYPPELAKLYEDVKTTPNELLTFFHHVPYTWKLDLPGFGGKTVIQYIYDSHYKGADEAAELGREWATLEGKIDPALYSDVKARLEYQAGHAIVWRDAIVQYFLKLSGIPDDKGRAGHYPGRLEAEDAKLTGYKIIDVQPWEDASGGKGVSCGEANCSAEWTYDGRAGRLDVAVQYFDLQGGDAKFSLLVDGQTRASWVANATLPSRRPHGDNSTRYVARGVELKPGDVLRVEGTPDKSDPAALDYIELEPAPLKP
ncbi:MAG TPA: alpha-glucuronidase family glycosyl hydrolase [Terracidiphilus sp.]|nr:alpha-glucuronidase family glycosyl hydrolase [Terracidiphilus sp.]